MKVLFPLLLLGILLAGCVGQTEAPLAPTPEATIAPVPTMENPVQIIESSFLKEEPLGWAVSQGLARNLDTIPHYVHIEADFYQGNTYLTTETTPLALNTGMTRSFKITVYDLELSKRITRAETRVVVME